MRWLLFVALGTLWSYGAAQDEQIRSSTRLMRDIMEIFAPKSENPEKSSDSESLFTNLLPPFGINRQTSNSESFQELPSRGAELAQSVARMFGSSRKEPLEDSRHPLMPIGSDGKYSNAKNWAGIAKDVMGLFGVNPPTTTTTTTPSPVLAGLQMLNPKFYQQVLMPEWMHPLNPFRKQEQDVRRSPPTAKDFFGDLTSVFNTRNPGTQVDTGGNIFDRLVVRENSDPEDPLASMMGGRFNERGIQWTDGNLKLVNKKGNKLLGSEVAVHDRSIDIPVQRWFDIANNIVGAYSSPETSLFPPKRHDYHHHDHHRDHSYGYPPYVAPRPVIPVYVPPPIFRPEPPFYSDYNNGHHHHGHHGHHGHHRGGW
ncbi:hypothetical protein FO519_008412 [Halicephalobus sp. NKZ332]|nr:hypothetical protein FO519_008412 [Halicephalobus sp. NKZ332]